MANKTIPELEEIEVGDLESTHLTILETGLSTNKLRLSTIVEYLQAQAGNALVKKLSVIFDGSTTGDVDVDVSASVNDARLWQWMLKKPEGGSTLGEQILLVIKTVDAATVRLGTGDFALDAGTYTLLGVGGN